MPCPVQALIVTLEQRRTELYKKRFSKIVENPLDVLHPLIPFNERPSKDLRNSRSYPVKPRKTNLGAVIPLLTNAQLFFYNSQLV